MNTKSIAVALTAFGALAAVPLLTQAATVNLSQWAYGDSWGNVVEVSSPTLTVAAGGFKGAVAFASGGEMGFSGVLNNFVTYCVELDEAFALPSGNLTGYSVVDGSGYSAWSDKNSNGKSAVAVSNRLGQLMSYVGANAALVDDKAESTSLQLAIWNVIYDSDDTVSSGLFSERSGSGYNAYADALLTGSSGWTGLLDVYVLSRSGSQDFLLTKNTGRSVTPGMPGINAVSAVPEPASLALAALALGVAGASTRRRRG